MPISVCASFLVKGLKLTARRYTTKAFGQVMGKAAKVTIVEAENIVPVGDIHPDNVHLQGIYVDRIVPSTVEKVIEIRKLKEVKGQDEGKKSEALSRRERIARRTSKELKHGYYVNLGVGELHNVVCRDNEADKVEQESRRWRRVI